MTIIAKLAISQQELPPGVKIDVVKEQATYIKARSHALEEHLVLGSLLASFIVWLFIRDWRMVLISSIAIPTSIVTTFTLMRMMDFTLNSMTLLGLTLAVGIVIDDAIIVMENIYRFIEEKGMPPMEAAIEATQEIALAVIATTISLVIIFVPIAFMSGYAKRFMNQFGWTMAMSIMVSMLVAFTLTPTLSARLLKRKTSRRHGGEGGHHSGWMETMLRPEPRLVDEASLGHRGDLRRRLRFDVHRQPVHRPRLDAAGRSERAGRMARNARKARRSRRPKKLTLEIGHKLEQDAGRDGGSRRELNDAYGAGHHVADHACCWMTLDERDEIGVMGQKVREITRDYAYARPRITFPNALGGRDTFAPIRAMLLGPDMRPLVEMAKEVKREDDAEPALTDVKANLNLNNPEIQVNIDRQLGVRSWACACPISPARFDC